MFARLISHVLWLTIMGLIAGTTALGLFLGYQGLLRICMGQYLEGGILLGLAPLPELAAYILIKNVNDLIDR